MSRSQLPLNALRAFEAAARHASFTHAAEELHVTQAAVSHQVKALEERLGVALFVRRPRGLEITSEGEALLPDLRDAFDRMTNALERVGRKANSGTLSVSLVTTFALGWLAPRLHRFQSKHPEIEVRMTTTQRRIDFAREDFDCAIRFTVQPEPELHATRLFSDVLTPLCGKRYKDKLKTLDDLKRVPFIDMTYDPEWAIWLRAVGMGDFKPKRVLTFDSTMIAVEAAMEGAGVAVGPAVPALSADRRQRQGVVVRVSAGLGQPTENPRLRGMADRGAERTANAVGPNSPCRERASLIAA
jgi:DNA-binding transcriptional LysR family regulator